MRVGLFREIPSPDDQRLQRIQKNIIQAVETLTADHDVLSVPVVTLVVTGQIPAGKSVVVFRGNTGQTLTLPQAKSQGDNVASLMVILNSSANAVTIVPSAGDTLNGATSLVLAAGGVLQLTSDGVGVAVG